MSGYLSMLAIRSGDKKRPAFINTGFIEILFFMTSVHHCRLVSFSDPLTNSY